MQSNLQLYAFKPAKKSPEGVTSGVPLLIDTDAKSKKGGILYPSVFTLWILPETLPHVVVVPPASRYLIEGADLMAPGINLAPSAFFEDNENDSLKKVFAGPYVAFHDKHEFLRGQKVAIRVAGNPLPFAVGYTLMNDKEFKDSGKKGRFAKVVNCYRDQLWEWGVDESKGETDGIPNDGFRQHEVGPTPEAKQIVESIECVAALAMERLENDDTSANDDLKTINEEIDSIITSAQAYNIPLWELSIQAGVNPPWLFNVFSRSNAQSKATGAAAAATTPTKLSMEKDDNETPGNSSSNVDPTELAWNSLLQAVRVSVKESTLPMRASELWAQHILPSRPADSVIEIKKTSFKKVSNLLQAAADEGILKLGYFDGELSAEEVQDIIENNPRAGDVETVTDSMVLWVVGVDKKNMAVRKHSKWEKTAGDIAKEEDIQHSEDIQTSKGMLLSSSRIPLVVEVVRPPKELLNVVIEVLKSELQDAAMNENLNPADVAPEQCHILGGITEEEEDNEEAVWRSTMPIPFGIYVNGLAGSRRDMERSVREGADLSAVADEIWKKGGNIKDCLSRCRIRIDADSRTISDAANGILFRKPDIQTILARYIRDKKLTHDSDKRKVYLDQSLLELVGNKAQDRTAHSPSDKAKVPEMTLNNFPSLSIRANPEPMAEKTSGAHLTKEIEKSKLVEILLHKCTSFHIRVFENRDIVVQRGEPKTIQLYSGKVPNRQNKKSTLIGNLEEWGINPALMAKTVQREFAARATVETVPGSSNQEVMLQGDFINNVTEYIIKILGIPRKYVIARSGTVNRGAKAKGRN